MQHFIKNLFVNVISVILLPFILNCEFFTGNNNKFIKRGAQDSLFVLAMNDTLNLFLDRFISGSDSISFTSEADTSLGDTFNVSGESYQHQDTIYKNFYYRNDTLVIYFSYSVYASDSLTRNSQVLMKSHNSPAIAYANIDSMHIRKTNLKTVNTDYASW